MIDQALAQMAMLMERGGWVMWPLAALSVVALMLIFHRCWFFLATNNPLTLEKFDHVQRYLRQGEADRAAAMVQGDRTVYGRLTHRLIQEGASDASATEAVESQRHRLERFMPTLGTIITAAPMLGILGTVTGIIRVSQVFDEAAAVTDPGRILPGIGEALLTTVVGLIIALVVLFPYNTFRAQIERTLGRMESLIAAAQQAAERRQRKPA